MTQIQHEQLKPCPLCGAHLLPESDGFEHPGDDTCPLDALYLEARHISAWNTRPKPEGVSLRITGPDSEGDYWIHLSKGDNAAGINLGKPFGQVGAALLNDAAREASK